MTPALRWEQPQHTARWRSGRGKVQGGYATGQSAHPAQDSKEEEAVVPQSPSEPPHLSPLVRGDGTTGKDTIRLKHGAVHAHNPYPNPKPFWLGEGGGRRGQKEGTIIWSPCLRNKELRSGAGSGALSHASSNGDASSHS
ncbi:unnamed protein product, partial [Discosporangium mesarthrocarpum]